MAKFKSIPLSDLAKYRDPFALFQEDGIALAKSEEDPRVACITIGWGAIGTLFNEPSATVYIHKTRFSEHVFREADLFSICFFDHELDRDVDTYYGAKSSRDIDKFNDGPFTPEYLENTPVFAEARLVILCEKSAQTQFAAEDVYHHPQIENWYASKEGHSLFIGKIKWIYIRN